MGKNFKASSKLTAKFLVVLMVLQAALFALTAFGETEPTAVTIHERTATGADVSGKTIVAFKNTAFTLVAVPNTTVTSTAYKKNYWKSSALGVINPTDTITAIKSFTPVAKGTTTISVFNTTNTTGPTNSVIVNVYSKLTSFTPPAMIIKLGKVGYISEPVLAPTDADVSSTVYSLTSAELNKGVVKLNTTDGTDTVFGAVYAAKSGTATITVTKNVYYSTTPVVKTFVVTVPEPVKSIAISANGKDPAPDNLSINAGKKTILKTVFTSAAGVTKKPTNVAVTWTKVSGDPEIDVNSKGEVTTTPNTEASIGKSAVLKATAVDSWNNASDTITVTVGKELKTFSLAQSNVLMKSGSTKQINISLKSDNNAINPTVTSVTYTAETGKTDILTVDANTGLITANTTKKAGIVRITVRVTPADGSAVKTAVVTAAVVADVEKIVLTAPATASDTKPMKLYSKVMIKATVTPSTALKLNTVRFTSADSNIAFVNPYTGEVTAVGVGNTTISASAVTSGATVIGATTAGATTVPVYVTDPDGVLHP
jgi:hypothetical protein